MSIEFNNTTTRKGIIQGIERALKMNSGDISGNTTKLKDFTAEINVAKDEVDALIQAVGGKWGHDDPNHTKYPELTMDLVANQRDYFLIQDQQGNYITDIYKVFVKGEDADSIYQEVCPIDSEREEGVDQFYDGQEATGVPYRYNKNGGGFFFDPIPDYNQTDGIKVLFQREGSYFTFDDTTKVAGFSPLHQEYLILKPSYRYARDNGLSNKDELKRDLDEMKKSIEEYYGNRDIRDETVFETSSFNYR